MTGWLTALRDRPIAEQERHTALVATATALIAVTVPLALTRPTTPAVPARSATKVSTATATVVRSPHTPAMSSSADISAEAIDAGRAFLAGYLAYAYGSAPAGRISEAARSLIASLRIHPPRVSPAMRASRPRVLEVHVTPTSTGRLGVSAVVNAGGLIDYTLELTLARQDSGLLVIGVEQD